MRVIPIQGQSLLDIALQTTGSIEGVFELAELNGISVTDSVEGIALSVDGLTVLSPQAVAYYKTNSIIPTTDRDLCRAFDDSFDLTFY